MNTYYVMSDSYTLDRIPSPAPMILREMDVDERVISLALPGHPCGSKEPTVWLCFRANKETGELECSIRVTPLLS